MKSQKIKKESIIYQAKSGAIELRGDSGRETVRATISKMETVQKSNVQKCILQKIVF